MEHDAARMESILAASLASAASTAPAGGKSRALQRAALASLGVTTKAAGASADNNDSVHQCYEDGDANNENDNNKNDDDNDNNHNNAGMFENHDPKSQ